MTIHQIAVFIIRLIALVLAVAGAAGLLSLSQLLATTLATDSSMSGSTWFVMSMMMLVQYSVYAALWLFAERIASLVLPKGLDAEQTTYNSKVSLYQWQVLGVVLIGLWTLIHAVSDAGYWLAFIHYLKGQGDVAWSSYIAPEHKAHMLATGVSLLLCIILLFTAPKLVRALFYSRPLRNDTQSDV